MSRHGVEEGQELMLLSGLLFRELAQEEGEEVQKLDLLTFSQSLGRLHRDLEDLALIAALQHIPESLEVLQALDDTSYQQAYLHFLYLSCTYSSNSTVCKTSLWSLTNCCVSTI